jgi:ubiquinone/menaquinone biosynthesis C-methylase UbiE
MSYDGSAAAWARVAALVYDPLAEQLVARSPYPLPGARALDLGTGTGAASRALLACGARPVGLDLAYDMVAFRRDRRPSGVVGDARRLPFRNAVFDAVVAAFCLNHVPDPGRVLAECRRVLVTGGVVLASAFSTQRRSPEKDVVDAVVRDHGWEEPPYFRALHERTAPLVGSATAMLDVAVAAGLRDVLSDECAMPTGVVTAEQFVDYRLSMPQFATFLARLPDHQRHRLVHAMVCALGGDPVDYRPAVVVLAARS